VLILVAIGIASRARTGPQGRALFVASFEGLYAVVLFALLAQYGYLSRRHAFPPITLLMGYGALGAIVLSNRSWLALVMTVFALISLPKALSDHRSEEIAGRQAAEWIAGQPLQPGRVASAKSKLGFYANREWRPLWREGALRELSALHSDGVRFVIAEQNAMDEQLAPIGPLRGGGGLVLLERHRVKASGRSSVVFELVFEVLADPRAGGP
jgi:hypothetical protein